MPYAVHEIYASYQGEGAMSGTPAVFCRLRGCNLWSGHEHTRTQAKCRFCDTQFVGAYGTNGGVFTRTALVKKILSCWQKNAHKEQYARSHNPYIIMTGGEPMLQLDTPLIDALHTHGCRVAIETNGTLPVPDSIDWICVSPKFGTEIQQKTGHELKVVWPQSYTRQDLNAMAHWHFKHFFLQPLDDARKNRNFASTMATCAHNSPWRLSLQTHKILDIP
ncbi:MAG: 7-carboxy-7-deazaguanine synthase [Alphaproteobacteria bacterium GM202ARS2]|nr:7-carboxy-7-deazaguanine synthase [Alphaproteobacteria bacterium GM202ARS2]